MLLSHVHANMCSYVFHSCSLHVDQGLDWTVRRTGCVWKFIPGVLLCFEEVFRSRDKNISVFFINKLFVNMNGFGKFCNRLNDLCGLTGSVDDVIV